ncbi:helix-turn-helix transcriptional regulator [Erysipelothrix anatis]|uniref:helix-turn-helix domain-containing protein n=1 Tax=Erysipelothrix anatis TaxID=2683713 RepID=UPI002E273D9E
MKGVDILISYDKLWKITKKKGINKKELANLSNLSQFTINKLVHQDTVNTETIEKICRALNCNIGDICDVILTDTYERILGNEEKN